VPAVPAAPGDTVAAGSLLVELDLDEDTCA
jgi:hypothetical protein